MAQPWKKPFGKTKALEFEEKEGIVWHIDMSSMVWTLIHSSKLANHIARLLAIENLVSKETVVSHWKENQT